MANTLEETSEKRKTKKFRLWKSYFIKERDSHICQLDSYFSNFQSAGFNESDNYLYVTHEKKKKSKGSNLESRLDKNALKNCVTKGKDFLFSLQEGEGYWNARLDSVYGLNAQYILFKYFMGIEKDPVRDQKIINYMIDSQCEDGGWNIYYGGPGHLSYSVIVYFALKFYGHSAQEPMMQKARDFILSQGGIAKSNMETRFWLALFDQCSWKGLPPIPVQIMLMPNNFVFSIYNVSYWVRIALIPMSIIYHQKLVIKPPEHAYIPELYCHPDEMKNQKFQGEVNKRFSWENLLLKMTKAAKFLEKASPPIIDKIALKKATNWILSHQDQEGDWGGIYPAMQYSLMALKVRGYANDSSEIRRGIEALKRYEIETDRDIMLTSCTSPVWDTAWTVYAMNVLDHPTDDTRISQATEWLYSQQILRESDWAIRNSDALPGGWCFQFVNDFYPDTDDTAVVLMSLLPTLKDKSSHEAFKIGVLWLISMQNDDGGWGAFERNVDKDIMNYLPLNDLQNFLDQSTADVTGRILECMGQIGFTKEQPFVKRAIHFLKKQQEESGAWYGRWGVNYIYGTWSVLRGLRSVGKSMSEPYIQKAIEWLKSVQNEDGGWGESCLSYEDPSHAGIGVSTASQTAWALLALIAGKEESCPEVEKGIQYLINTQNPAGGWDEEEYTGTGFERAFYLRYHYYPYYFPMLALGAYYKATSQKL
ncbi:MAG: squalene--hopene cyclase [Spirochaetota bacterium]|nr:squalene--hopene cyclase [Spirochaetota bacterium]